MEKFRIKPNKKVELSKFDPRDQSAAPGTKQQNTDMLATLSARLDKLQDVFYGARSHKFLIVLQGMDTSGKDGTIRHVFKSVDPLGLRVANFKGPTEQEKGHDFLWRIHQQMPGDGEIVIFNRSHYEDVLITRVHEWIDKKEVKRRLRQINDFELMLSEHATVIRKFFLYISKEEQKKRLEERLSDPEKHWKFQLGDVEERKLWDDYMKAYQDMLENTSTKHAPWYVVPADSKTNRNLFISRVLVQTLEDLKLTYPEPGEDLSKIIIK
ncbi:MAG: polyphosphate kinase 2 family protein [Pseudomonadota bacterium]